MTPHDRVQAFQRAFPKWSASWPWLTREQGRDVLYAVWVLGNDYRNRTAYYGAFPPGLLARVMALFPDHDPTVDHSTVPAGEIPILQAFSGSLPMSSAYVRLDCGAPTAELRCNVLDLPTFNGCAYAGAFGLAIADPPYSAADASKYGTPPVNRGAMTRALAAVVRPGGFLVWLDTCWPMHAKEQWLTVGRIFVQRSTNHRVRALTIFERAAA